MADGRRGTANGVEADAEASGYRWETEYERTWEVVGEDGAGGPGLKGSLAQILAAQRRRRLAERAKNVRLGIVRHLILVLDASAAMLEKDLAPDRRAVAITHLLRFLEAFFDENPLSQLGIVTTSDKRAAKASALSGNAGEQRKALEALRKTACTGEASLQNALELAYRQLRLLPRHSSREILIVMGSLSSCDPSNVQATIAKLKTAQIRVSVIGLAAEVYLCRRLASETGGTYGVILDEAHLGQLLSAESRPQPSAESADSSLVRMGFPEQSCSETPSLCACHSKFTESGFHCPQCEAKYCSLPVECRACGLTLVTGPQLARSYAHLFPLRPFKEEAEAPGKEAAEVRKDCFACLSPLSGGPVYACPLCSSPFCADCDLYIHEALQTCPGCR